MLGSSGIYFRSGADVCGNVNEAGGFVINSGDTLFDDVKTPGAGHIVFDVEGRLQVAGVSANSNALHILSLEVAKTGCPIVIAVEADEPGKKIFPQRTFNANGVGEFKRYNSAAFLINNDMTIIDASIVHTDQNHNVFERDNLGRSDVHSEPTYIGGEAHKIECQGQTRPRPKISLENSIFRFHTNAGLTGVDVLVPNEDDPAGNVSTFRFYNNGCAIDKSYGRILILGTSEGSLSCDGTLVDRDSHLDVIQTRDQSQPNANADHRLEIDVATNDECVILDPTPECAVHTIFQGGASNISVGTNQAVDGLPKDPDPLTSPKLLVKGSFISFETAGGSLGFPEASGTTGEGGIFVDQNGCFSVDPAKRVNISAMVVKSGNGVVDLPKNQVFFDNRIGITKWQVDLSTGDRILVDVGESISDFTFDWGGAKRDCCNFTPYELKNVPESCECCPIVEANITSIPEIKGAVDQLQIKRSRLGDQVHLKVNNGLVRELVFLGGFNTAEAPMAVIAVDNNGQVGLGTAHRNVDSLSAQVKLGINGITIVPNGDGVVELNEDIVIDNLCHILPGPGFASNPGEDVPQKLVIHTQDEKEFRIKSTGVLDLSKFFSPNQILEFAGAVRVVAEPGAQIIIGDKAKAIADGLATGGILRFTDKASLTFDRVLDPSLMDKTTADELQPILVKISGYGNIVFEEASSCLLHQQSFLAVQSHPTCAPQTDITITLNHQAKFEIGNAAEPGGSFQVGNTANREADSVKFTLVVDGPNAKFELNREGMLGAGAGVVSKLPGVAHNSWTIASLYNVDQFQIMVNEGMFKHNQIWPGSSTLASLFAVGGMCGEKFGFTYDGAKAIIPGGGNVYCIAPVAKKGTTRSRRAYENMVIIQSDSNLPLDHFSWIPAESEHAQEIHIRLEPGATMSGAQGMVRLQINSNKSLDLEGRELVLLSKFVAQMPEKQAKIMRSKRSLSSNNSIVYVAPGGKLVLTKELEVKNEAKNDLVVTTDDLAILASLLTGENVSYRTGLGVFPVVEDTASSQANLMQSKDMFDQFPPLGGLVSASDYHEYLTHINTNDYSSPMASISPFAPTQSRVGYIHNNTDIVRKPITTIINGISGDSTDQQGSQTRGAVGHHRHNVTGMSYAFVEIPHLQPGS